MNGAKEEKFSKFNEIIENIKQKPKKGMEMFYDAYGKYIEISAYAFCKNKEIAEETVNDVLLKIWKMADRMPIIEKPQSWLMVMIKHCALDHLRKKSEAPLEENIPSTKDEIQGVIDEMSFYYLLKDLNEEEQIIFIDKFVALMDFKSIAENLDKPLTTVSSMYYRALEKLGKKINKNL